MSRTPPEFVICPLCASRVPTDQRTERRKAGNTTYQRSLQPGGRPMSRRGQGRKKLADHMRGVARGTETL